ncbi:MAG: hypothetical protein LBT95_01925 [Treponema sp.]|jgi:hypothetical protein|nr:hypothetical protein [Treponema sp.]
MWYKAASVIDAIEQCNQLGVAGNANVPSCPKKGNNSHCHNDFPECEGKNQKCSQKAQLINDNGDPSFLYFDYYLSEDDRDGRIKKRNTTLLMLISKYQINERLMIPVT